ncbi:hypothetical protein D1007_46867 [Hordeum vulgare]|nr:hypothetical protein D1007_46867 [Hordeum vulgare]
MSAFWFGSAGAPNVVDTFIDVVIIFITGLSEISEHPELYKGQDSQANETGGKPTNSNNPGGPPVAHREAATDELLLERFRKREKFRVMRR